MLTFSKTFGEGTPRLLLISRVIHAVNEELATLVSYCHILSNNVNGQDLKEDVQRILEEASKVSKVAKQLQYLLEVYEPVRKMADLNKLIQISVRLFREREKIILTPIVLNLDPNLETVLIDPDQIQSVFLTLIDIVKRAMIRTHGIGTLHVGTKKMDNRVQVEISYSNDGVPRESLPDNVQPFTPGIGGKNDKEMLVLLACLDIVRNHCGEILVDSGSGREAFFFIELPTTSGCLNNVKAAEDYNCFHIGDKKGLTTNTPVPRH